MTNNIKLKDFDRTAKLFISFFLITLGIGICTGLYYVYLTTSMTPAGSIEQFNGSQVQKDEIPEKFEKPLENMILTTHNHVNMFAIISLLIGGVFYFNSIINGKLKLFLLLEPFISTILTFASIWLMRYIDYNFVYLMITSAIIMYICWAAMILVSLYETTIKNN